MDHRKGEARPCVCFTSHHQLQLARRCRTFHSFHSPFLFLSLCSHTSSPPSFSLRRLSPSSPSPNLGSCLSPFVLDVNRFLLTIFQLSSELWWVNGQQDTFAWTCHTNTQYPSFTVLCVPILLITPFVHSALKKKSSQRPEPHPPGHPSRCPCHRYVSSFRRRA